MKVRKQRQGRRRGGVALAEFAISLSLLITIVFGCVDAGRFAYSYISIASASNEAAAFASQHGFGEFGGPENWAAAVRQRAIAEGPMLDPPLDADDVTVDANVPAPGLVSVSVAYTFETLISWPAIPKQWPMSRRVILSQTP